VALGAELSADYNERTSIQGVKTTFFLLGLFFASVAGMFIFFKPTPEYPSGQLNPGAYSSMGAVSSLIFIAFGLICFFTTKKYIPYLPKRNKQYTEKFKGILKLFTSFMSALKNENFKYVALGYLFINLASSIVSTLGLHVFTYTFNLDNRDIAFIIGSQFLMSILSQPVWVAISKKIDKKPSVIAGLLISLLGSAILAVLVMFKDSIAGNFVCLLPASILVGFGIGGLFSIPLSMVADTIDIEELNSGKRMEGIYYGCLTLFYKLAQSGAVLLLGILLDIIRFDSSISIQPDNTVFILGLVLSFGAILMFILALLFYSKYKLNRNSVGMIQKQIVSRNNIMKQV
jgi:Na+/melibiose symporter-like transporter